MDIHYIESIPFTEEDAYRAHLRDVAVQDQFGLIYKKYYLNLEEGTICCLMEGPSKEACEISHIKAHGIGPCNIVEITREHEFPIYFGDGTKNERDLALTLSGEVDTGYRTLMQVKYHTKLGGTVSHPDILKYVKNYEGKMVHQPETVVLASFIKPQHAISCAAMLRDYIKALVNPTLCTIVVVTGKPVDDHGKRLFDKTLGRLASLGRSAPHGKIVTDKSTREAYERSGSRNSEISKHLHTLSNDHEKLLDLLQTQVEDHIDNPYFKTESLQSVMGKSKAQSYRKIKGLTGLSPNGFIREIRLRNALVALEGSDSTIAEVAYAHGFNSPTYFTRVFKERFGLLPTDYIKSHP